MSTTRQLSSFGSIMLNVSVVVIFLILHISASLFSSHRGEAGLFVAALVLLACLIAQRVLWRQSSTDAVRAIGLERPTGRSIRIALGVCALLLLFFPVYAAITHSRVTFYPRSLLLLPGLFAQAGIAEETLFRGFLFGNLRRHNPFWRAAFLSAGPFVVAHIFLFPTMNLYVALAALSLALITSFPLAHLYELGGRTIWAPALLHFTMQGPIKLIVMSEVSVWYPISWMIVCAVVSWGVFVFKVRTEEVRAPNLDSPLSAQ